MSDVSRRVLTVAAPLLASLVALRVVRTALEDQTLRARLEGYEAYAHRARWRLPPGAW